MPASGLVDVAVLVVLPCCADSGSAHTSIAEQTPARMLLKVSLTALSSPEPDPSPRLGTKLHLAVRNPSVGSLRLRFLCPLRRMRHRTVHPQHCFRDPQRMRHPRARRPEHQRLVPVPDVSDVVG